MKEKTFKIFAVLLKRTSIIIASGGANYLASSGFCHT
jgi:hypothetical protein